MIRDNPCCLCLYADTRGSTPLIFQDHANQRGTPVASQATQSCGSLRLLVGSSKPGGHLASHQSPSAELISRGTSSGVCLHAKGADLLSFLWSFTLENVVDNPGSFDNTIWVSTYVLTGFAPCEVMLQNRDKGVVLVLVILSMNSVNKPLREFICKGVYNLYFHQFDMFIFLAGSHPQISK